MTLDINVPGGNPTQPGFSVQRSSSGLYVAAGAFTDSPVGFGVANDENGLSVNAIPISPPAIATGFTIYTFRRSGTFLVHPGWSLTADVMLVAGGGSGGGGYQGGGGGGGGFVDAHDFVIESAEQGDGDVIVGAGGAEVPITALQGNNGRESVFGPLIAYGGGYGSSEFAGGAYYHASDGASGGGGGPWDPPPPPHTGPQSFGPGGLAIHGDQGYPGCRGDGTSFYGGWHTAGGGGGAGQPGNMFGIHQPNGGHGRWCDIAGWGPYWNDPEWWDLEIRIVPWYGGGGGGMERPNLWSYLSGEGGFGGGGDPGASGASYTGGGGGGNGRLEYGHEGDAPGMSGGSGLVVIRILSRDERLVRTVTDVHTVTRISADQLHIDERGDEGGPA